MHMWRRLKGRNNWTHLLWHLATYSLWKWCLKYCYVVRSSCQLWKSYIVQLSSWPCTYTKLRAPNLAKVLLCDWCLCVIYFTTIQIGPAIRNLTPMRVFPTTLRGLATGLVLPLIIACADLWPGHAEHQTRCPGPRLWKEMGKAGQPIYSRQCTVLTHKFCSTQLQTRARKLRMHFLCLRCCTTNLRAKMMSTPPSTCQFLSILRHLTPP